MTWTPEPRIKINGTDYSGVTLNRARITYGRDEFLSQTRAPYATFEIITEAKPEPGEIWPGSLVEIDCKDTTGAYVRQFTGRISDLQMQVIGTGDHIRNSLSCAAVGSIGDMVLSQTPAYEPIYRFVSPQKGDFDHFFIYQLLSTGLSAAIETITPQINDLANPIDDLQGRIGTVDTGATYQVFAFAPFPEVRNAWDFAVEIANECGGQLWEDRQGLLNYRSLKYNIATAHTWPAELLDLRSYDLTVDYSETYTRINFDVAPWIDKPDPGPDPIYPDEQLIGDMWTLGDRAYTYLHRIESNTNKTILKNKLLENLNRYTIKAAALAFDLRAVPDIYVDELLAVDFWDPVTITGLPSSVALFADFTGRIYGYELELGQTTARLSLQLNELGL